MNTKPIVIACALLATFAARAGAEEVVVPMHQAEATGAGAALGSIRATDSRYGVVFTPDLAGLPAGIHGFHVHTNPSCDPKEQNGKMVGAVALAAGGVH